MKNFILFILFGFIFSGGVSYSQTDFLLTNVENRSMVSLNGLWKIIIDPYENGYNNFDGKFNEHGYFENKKPESKSDLVEYDFDKSESLYVPGDWNTQKEKLFFYEGTIWYKKSFDYKIKNNTRVFLYFGAVNYDAIVFLNGEKLGEHIGGFTPFDFEITNKIKDGNNFIVVKVDNKRLRNGVPTVNTDWWNYGGITRDVELIEEPETFIKDYSLQLQKGSLNQVSGWIKVDGKKKEQTVQIKIPDANIEKIVKTNSNGFAKFNFKGNFKLWSPENPFLYNVNIIAETDSIDDEIGFRSIDAIGHQILLNGKPVFLRGIAIHEEAPFRSGRAYSKEDALTLLNWAKELGCNYVRLAHYPHNENMIREAEKIGLMVWSEIPVYWTIQWENAQTLENALNQLKEMITRDKNRAPIIIWSMANETPVNEARMKFLCSLIDSAKNLDPTRLISAATLIQYDGDKMIINDPLGKYLDVIGVNEYLGWYNGKPSDAENRVWKMNYDKPLIVSELGGGALYGYHGDKDTRWTEEYQAYLYTEQIKMIKKIPFLSGISPWILMDFRSPRRPLPGIQDFYNRKGLISNKGQKKEAFFVLQKFYRELAQEKK
jgi:beta-glucuronidase